ncbi:hypothetical protein C8K36_1011279 [Rhodococcus sp. OK519]|uniref:hypothetical protein n=1 Tax=Rhodococcus sp. OK519 TaxID=2135729 RepID=UPI000D383769|nr:hypothetical protein C8K36_1011279 [Rhodococcus sp. OK519]
MTAALPRHTRVAHARTTVDLAGTAWPLYKIEALAAGAVAFLLVLLVTQALQPAVLIAAGVAVVVWWARRLVLAHRAAPPTH